MSLEAAAARISPKLRLMLAQQTATKLKGMSRGLGNTSEGRIGCVYFLEGPGGAIKIGYARDLTKRLASLQTGSPVRLRVLATVQGGSRLEREYHREFAGYALHGEWFSDNPRIRREVARLRKLARARGPRAARPISGPCPLPPPPESK